LIGSGIAFSVPLCVYVCAITLIDPFAYFTRFPSIVPVQVKQGQAKQLNYILWNLNDFRYHPASCVLLGDSRMRLFSTNAIQARSGEACANLAYGGGNLAEAISTFWYATGRVQLRAVYFGVNLELYNQSNSRDRVQGTVAILQNPLLYFTNRDVAAAAWTVARDRSAGAGGSVETPPMSREAFWQYQLTEAGTRYYAHYVYPAAFFAHLSEIAEHCRRHDVKLTFIVMPTHTDLQRLLDRYRLRAAEQRFLGDLAGIGSVLDFNVENEYTSDRSNFGDPFHMKASVIERVYLPRIWKPADDASRAGVDNVARLR
jgi:hypothetical protein